MSSFSGLQGGNGSKNQQSIMCRGHVYNSLILFFITWMKNLTFRPVGSLNQRSLVPQSCDDANEGSTEQR